METFGDILGAKKGKKGHCVYFCEKCHYKCSKKYDWTRHLLTAKHQMETYGDNLGAKKGKSGHHEEYLCEKCNKIYESRNGLWKHKQKCNFTTITNSEPSDKDLIMLLIKENSELKNMMIKVIENGTNNNNNTINTINSHNKTFNLQVFLNETCKDAMNISDFIESVKLQVSDLENVGKVGYIEGISNIIIKNLQALEVEKRPVHCTDQKREVMYVKEDNVWEKEDESNKKLRKAIRTIAHKNICMFKDFREKYPDCEDYDSKKNSQYNTIVYESMGGKGDNDYEKDTKIIKKIAKVVGIDKIC